MQKYECSRNGDCEITTATRNICKFCRYQKCLDVGMKPDGKTPSPYSQPHSVLFNPSSLSCYLISRQEVSPLLCVDPGRECGVSRLNVEWSLNLIRTLRYISISEGSSFIFKVFLHTHHSLLASCFSLTSSLGLFLVLGIA